MRIGFITGEYPPMEGGIASFTRELAASLVQQGQTVSILTDRQVGDKDDLGIQVCGQVDNWNRASLFQIRRWAESNRLDLVNLQYEAAAFQMAALVHWLPSRLGHIPTVTTFHDLYVPYLFPRAGELRFQALLILARRSAGVIVTNAEDEGRLNSERGIRLLCQIPIGSSIPPTPPLNYDRATWRQELGIPSNAVLVGNFGFLNASKGIDILMTGVATAIANGVNVYILMIGGRTGSSDPTNALYAKKIDDLVEDLNLRTRLQWTGFVDDTHVSGYMRACDFLALPFKDGVSFRRSSFIAGIAQPCAIITTTPAVALPEISDKVNVCLIPPDSPEELARAIQNLAENPALRQELQKNAKALSEHFRWDRIVSDTLAFYRRVIGETVA